jgi:hypothetical protein
MEHIATRQIDKHLEPLISTSLLHSMRHLLCKDLDGFLRNFQEQVEHEFNGMQLDIATAEECHENRLSESHSYAGVSFWPHNDHLS